MQPGTLSLIGELELKTPVVVVAHPPPQRRAKFCPSLPGKAKTVVPAVEALRKRKRQDETEFTTKISSKN